MQDYNTGYIDLPQKPKKILTILEEFLKNLEKNLTMENYDDGNPYGELVSYLTKKGIATALDQTTIILGISPQEVYQAYMFALRRKYPILNISQHSLPIDLRSKWIGLTLYNLVTHTYPNKEYELYESTKDEFEDVSEFERPTYWTNRILEILKEGGIRYTINSETGLYHIYGNLDLSYLNLESFGDIRFGTINGSFDCSHNKLTSLEGCPQKVIVSFNCSHNQLITLEGAPKYIGHRFSCDTNNLVSLKGAPLEVKGDFICDNNQLITLEGAPDFVGGNFLCRHNQLATLKGAPNYIRGQLYCSDNYLTTLDNYPGYIEGSLFGRYNPLTALGDIHSKVKGKVYVSGFLKDKKESFKSLFQRTVLRESVPMEPRDFSEPTLGDLRKGNVTTYPSIPLTTIDPEQQNLQDIPPPSDESELESISTSPSPTISIQEPWSPEEEEIINKFQQYKYMSTLPEIISQVSQELNFPYAAVYTIITSYLSLNESIDEEFGDVDEFERPTYWTSKVLELLGEKGIKYTINPKTKLYDVDGDVDLNYCGLESFGDIKFGTINGSFSCSGNKLATLEGAPRRVKRDFSCSGNKLISLKGAPQEVNGNFYCTLNYLITLKGAPDFVGGNFLCRHNQLATLGDIKSRVKGKVVADTNLPNTLQESREDEFGDVDEFDKPTYWADRVLKILKERYISYTLNPETGLYDVDGDVNLSDCDLESFGDIRFGVVTGYFNCQINRLTTLAGAPQIVRGYFDCGNNQLITLEGLPREIGGSFSCDHNQLITLEGVPREIDGLFSCTDNNLTSLKGSPIRVKGSFYCNDNRLTTLEGISNYIGKDLYCSRNPLIIDTKTGEIEGMPKELIKSLNNYIL